MNSTLVLFNSTLVPGNFLATGAYGPSEMAFDTGKDLVYVGQGLGRSNLLSIVSPTTDRQVGQISLARTAVSPGQIAYDPLLGELFVECGGAGLPNVGSGLYAVNDTNNSLVTYVGFLLPTGLVYDPTVNALYVANEYTNTVSEYDPATLQQIGSSIPIGPSPGLLAYDSGRREIVVASRSNGTVSLISDRTNAVVGAPIPVGSTPSGLAYDRGRGEIFVTNAGNSLGYGTTVSIINDTHDRVVANVTVGTEPTAAAYDPGKGEVFVANAEPVASSANYRGNVSVINDTTDRVVATVAVGSYPASATYVPAAGQVWVANWDSENVSVLSDQTNRVVATPLFNAAPYGIAYDSGKSELFITNDIDTALGSAPAFVVSDRTDQVVASVGVGNEPTAVAYDPAAGEVFVVNTIPASLSVINDTTDTVVATVSLSGATGSAGLAYDSAKGEIFVAGGGTAAHGTSPGTPNELNVVNTTTNRVVATLSYGTGGHGSIGVAYDRAKGQLFVTDPGGSNVSVISDATNRIVTNLSVGIDPVAAVYDPGSGEVFVACPGSANVAVINDTTYATSFVYTNGSIGGSPSGLAYAPGEVYVSDELNDSVGVIDDGTDQIGAVVAVGSEPTGIAYDSRLGLGYVVNDAQGTASILAPVYPIAFTETGLAPGTAWNVTLGGISTWGVTNTTILLEPNGVYPYSIGAIPGYTTTAGSGTAVVAGGPTSISVVFLVFQYPVAFEASGLGGLRPWNVTLGGVTRGSTAPSIPFSEPNGTYSYQAGGPPGYTIQNGKGTVTVAGGPETVTIAFSRIPTEYDVTFNESGLAAGTAWQVTLGSGEHSSTGASIAIAVENGSYPFAVSAPGYAPSPAVGTVDVDGAARSEAISFVLVTYPVAFNESGLAPGTSWTVGVAGRNLSSSTDQIVFEEPNGTYAYRIAPVGGYSTGWAGSFTVDGGAAWVAVPFALVQWPLTFAETGLPPGTRWSVTINGNVWSSTTSEVEGSVPNGTYAYIPGAAGDYVGTNGTVTVAGPTTQDVRYARTYALSFTETGLPAGRSWSVALNGNPGRNSTTELIVFEVTNGSYRWALGPIAGYTSTWSGTASVEGAGVTVATKWSAVTYPVTITEHGLPDGTPWAVTVAGGLWNSTTSAVAISEPNGTYPFTLGAVPGYLGQPSSGNLTVNGAAVGISIAFTGAGAGGGGPASVLSMLVYAGVSAGLAAVALVVVLLWRRRARRHTSSRPDPATATRPPRPPGTESPVTPAGEEFDTYR